MEFIERRVRGLVGAAEPGETARGQREAAGAVFHVLELLEGDRYRHEAEIRSLCRSAYLGGGVSLCRVLGRYKLYVDSNDVGIASHLIMDGYWEMWVTEALLRTVKPGMTAIDVGAHCGYYSVLLGDLVGPSGRVLAFEPNPPIARLLRRSVSINGFDDRTTVHGCALADAEGQVTLVVPDGEPKNAHVAPAGLDVSGVTVPTRRLDGIEGALDADIIKIDAEGAEEGIWRGMAGLLAQARPLTVVLEFTPGRYRDPGAFLDEIMAHGFTLSVITLTDGVQPTSRSEVLQGPPAVDQMLFLRR